MIRRKEDHLTTYKSDMFGGRGTVSYLHLAANEELCNKGRMLAILTIPEGGILGFHEHHGEIDIYHILKGKAEFNDNGTVLQFNEGDTTWIKPEQGHSIANVGKGDLQFISLVLFAKQGD